jgi:small subunit ribosomal protein S3
MTHTAHPYGQRLGIVRDWKNRWFVRDKSRFKEFLKADTSLRDWLKKRLKNMYVASVEIERSETTLRLIIKTARPGMIIGRNGEGIAKLRKEIEKKVNAVTTGERPELKIDVEEVRNPEANAQIVSEMVAEGLEKRMPFRRVMKQTIEKVMANREVQGVRIRIAGRVGGAEMARTEEIKRGRVPLQTLRADVEFARTEAYLAYTGIVGVKVWIYKGEIFDGDEQK